MPKLIARKEVELVNVLLVESSTDPIFEFKSGRFNVHAKLSLIDNGGGSSYMGCFYYSDKIIIEVTGDEDYTPDIPTNSMGGRDFSGLHQYFDDRQESYSAISRRVLRNIICYFRYELQQPFLDEDTIGAGSFTWKDDRGNDYGSLSIGSSSPFPPGTTRPQLNIKRLELTQHSILESKLVDDYEIDFSRQLLSNSQAAILNKDFRLAILEMAIAVEVSIKRAFISSDISSPMIAALSENNFLNCPPERWISTVAQVVFGESFNSVSKTDHKNIGNLFRCRNKVAHVGETWFPDNKKRVDVTSELLEEWYLSVVMLNEWLEKCLSSINSNIGKREID